MGTVKCKKYHRATSRTDPGCYAKGPHRKGRCPGWASDQEFRQRLMDEAVVEKGCPLDFKGRPKRIWNAVGGMVSIGVSTNEEAEAYNCYPHVPVTSLHSELARRAERTVEQFMKAS